MATDVTGVSVLDKALRELGSVNTAEWKRILKGSVRDPMNRVRRRAQANFASFSPGKADVHLTYLGNWRGAGFAAKSLVVNAFISKREGIATAVLGVKNEAFYAVSFFELGLPSRGIPRHPGIVDAMESSSSEAVKAVGGAMKKHIEAIARKRYRESLAAAGRK